MEAQLYANTADPGPALSSHWPNGQTAPQQCNTAAAPGADKNACAYDYGWNAGQDSYHDAVNAYVALGWTPSGSTRTPVANSWWLDVETANSWEGNSANNIAELQGEVDYLKSVGVASVGFYAPAASWQAITGGTTQFSAYLSWVPGAASLADAQARCSSSSFTGGPVALVQFTQGGMNADTSCAVSQALAFATTPQILTAGKPSAPIAVRLPQAASQAVSVSVSSSSATGLFSPSTTGPWTATLSLAVAAGGTQSPTFYYQDTTAGMATLTATALGYTNATQNETIKAAPVAPHPCIPPSVHDHGFELVLVHTYTRVAATRVLRLVTRQARAIHLQALIERDTCADFEIAISGFPNRTAALAAMRQARREFHRAALEHT
jgi:hypothetical protein